MDKSANTAVSTMLPLLLVCGASCDAYDATLVRHAAGASRQQHDAALDPDDAGVEGEERRDEGTCGNAVVDATERCDIAIASGRPGACPEGCSGREGCIQRVLVGSACTARCQDVPISQAISGDGCCPSEASASIDDDCASVCGNRVVERGERCDPPETCARAEACKTEDGCERASYRGDAASCTASCEIRRLESCVDADGCCPSGCTAEVDGDCGTPGMTDAGEVESECRMQHPGGECAACDCENCQSAVKRCLNAPGEDGPAKCQAIVGCAEQHECAGMRCLCGALDMQACQRAAPGPCADEFRRAAGTRDVYQTVLQVTYGDGALRRAMDLMECRRMKCQQVCGL